MAANRIVLSWSLIRCSRFPLWDGDASSLADCSLCLWVFLSLHHSVYLWVQASGELSWQTETHTAPKAEARQSDRHSEGDGEGIFWELDKLLTSLVNPLITAATVADLPVKWQTHFYTWLGTADNSPKQIQALNTYHFSLGQNAEHLMKIILQH